MNDEMEPKFQTGDHVALTVREPAGSNARADYPGNYVPTRYVGKIEGSYEMNNTLHIRVRWHLPAAYGYNTRKGTVSTLINVCCDNCYLETRTKARNVVATIEKISEEEYERLLREAEQTI